jgi:hypothetical protein
MWKSPDTNRATGKRIIEGMYDDDLVLNPKLRAMGVRYGMSYYDSDVLGPQHLRPYEDEQADLEE